MKRSLLCALPLFALSLSVLRADSFPTEFSATPMMEREATLVVQLLEHAHYSKKSVSELDMAEFLNRYMRELDHSRLFFTREDHDEIVERFAPDVEFGLFQGDLDPAFKVFSRYKARTLDRLEWILARLEEGFDLNSDMQYTPDRREADWPADGAEARELWEKRIKHEVLQMVLDDQPIRNLLDLWEERFADWRDETPKPADEDVRAFLRDLLKDQERKSLFDRVSTRVDEDGSGWAALSGDEIADLLREKYRTKEMEYALERIERRYERLKQSVTEIDALEIQEVYLTTLTKMFDPHSTFLSANTLEDFGISMRLSLVGIGAVLTTEDGYCVIRELVPGGPADLTRQLQPEDRIVAVAQEDEDPVDVVDMKLRRVVNMIRGEKGTKVTLTVIPADAPDPSVREEVTIVRDEVKLTARQARGKVYDFPLENGESRSLGVIEIPSFYGSGDTDTSTTEDVKELIGQMQDMGIDGLMLDLRRNGGGLLNEAIKLTGLFIEAGPVVQIRDSSGSIRVDPVPRDGQVYSGPLGVLVSKNSASASEIVAGALQSYQRAIVVGESSTHGKGTVQAVFELSNYLRSPQGASGNGTGATKMTVQKFYLPDGASTQNRGMIPDVVIPSFNDHLPIGESSLPNAMAWDTLDGNNWERYKDRAAVSFPITSERRDRIVGASKERQDSLEEFSYWNENIKWFRDRQEQKAFALNLEKRRGQRETDREFRDTMNEIEDRLAREKEFSYTEITLSSSENDEPAYPADPEQPDPRDIEAPGADDDRERLDIHLRETLRVLNDLVTLQREHRDSVAATR